MKTFRQFLTEASKTVWQSPQGERRITGTTSVGGQERYLVVTAGNSLPDLINPAEIEAEIRRDEANAASRAKAKQAIAQSAAQDAVGASLDGFENTLTSMMRARAVVALTQKGIQSNGTFYRCIRDLVRAHVAQGWKVQGERFVSPHGTFLTQQQITKLGLQYADYLSKR